MTNTNKSNNRSKVEISNQLQENQLVIYQSGRGFFDFLNFDSHDDTDQIVVVRRYCNSLLSESYKSTHSITTYKYLF